MVDFFSGFNVSCNEGYVADTGSKHQEHFKTVCLYGSWLPPPDIKCEKIPTTTTTSMVMSSITFKFSKRSQNVLTF